MAKRQKRRNFADVRLRIMDKKISVVINTYNAARHLRCVIESVRGFDEVLVCDMESTDGTVDIARECGCRVVTFEKKDHKIVEPARQFAIDHAQYDRVLVVDADELVSRELTDYLYSAISRSDAPAGIAIPRKNYFMGRFMHSCYPDYILRFFDRRVTQWPPVIHTLPSVSGVVEKIPRERKDLAFEHLANDTVGDIMRKSNTYSDYEVERRRNKNYGLAALMLRPLFRFFKAYVLKGGFLDGMPGLIHAVLDAHYQFGIVAKIMERSLQQTVEYLDGMGKREHF